MLLSPQSGQAQGPKAQRPLALDSGQATRLKQKHIALPPHRSKACKRKGRKGDESIRGVLAASSGSVSVWPSCEIQAGPSDLVTYSLTY